MTKKILILPFLALLAAAPLAAKRSAAKPKVRNVIFMIGDGNGLAQMQLGMLASPEPLAVTRAEHVALATTHSANNRVTDSAAGGTALATGTKTNNGTVGIAPDGEELRNLTERARQRGMATGIVVTKDITDATPAAFMAHVPNRGMAERIAAQIADSGVDVLSGGGRKAFEKRSDGADYADSLRARGYTVVYTPEELMAAEGGKVAALLADVHMPSSIEGRGDYLADATQKAIGLLHAKSSGGFFIMVESSQIDSRSHANDGEGTAKEVVDFNLAIGRAFDFADRNPGTLVVVTADHETGGLTLPSGNADFLLSDRGVKTAFSTGGHTAAMVPVYAYGTGSEAFTTIMDNTDIPKKIAALLGMEW